MERMKAIFRKEPIMAVSAIFALISMLFVMPDKTYLHYIDFKTLSCLLCLMLSLKGIEREGLLKAVSMKLSAQVGSYRSLIFLLVFICFFISMFMTNDVALITFVPITLAVASLCGLEKELAFIIVLQTLAANIGSSLTPIGNPQNLFLFMRYKLSFGDFLSKTLPFVSFGGLLLTIICFFVPDRPIRRESPPLPTIRQKPVMAYGAMFILAVMAVFGLIPGWIATLVIVVAAAVIDRRTLAEVDYSLLLTFTAIFILVGNMARIDWIYRFIAHWVQKDTMMTAIISSQFISNVPAAVMLSGFTENAAGLIAGVNIGGMGTLIASMASVISYKLYITADKKGTLHYLRIFTILNVLLLLLSVAFEKFLFGI